MSRKIPGIYIGRARGYGDCWYCSETVVDARTYQIVSDGDTLTILVCGRRVCNDSARNGDVA